jgi:hypothetical protein
MPERLLADLQANPAAIGVYALIARLFLIYQEQIPLSAADLQRYDPTLSYGAARGALQRLTTLRWLTDHPGHKNCYTPTWGAIKGTPRHWQMDAPTLGRPAHVTTMRLDRRLLDVGLGRLVPHQTYPAQTSDRYLEQPIFTLRDVGAYAQALGGWSITPTATLLRYGLIRDGQAQRVPSVEALIALASQRMLSGDGAPPTEHGLRKLGLDLSDAPPGTTPGQPLFFVDHGLIPDLITCSIPDLIPLVAGSQSRCGAEERARSATDDHLLRKGGTPGILRERSDSSPNPPTLSGSGGEDHQPSGKICQEVSRPDTQAAQLLRSINAFPSSIEELATMPAELVGRAIAYAESEPGIESIAGWVVEALRRLRDEGWPIPSPRMKRLDTASRERPIDIEKYTNGAYGDLFRRGSDTTGLDDFYLNTEQNYLGSPDACAPAQYPEENPGQLCRHTGIQGVIDEVNTAVDPPRIASSDETLTRQVQEELMLRCGRRYGRVIEGLWLHVDGGTSLIIFATFEDMSLVQRELIGALQGILIQLGAPPQLTFTTRVGWEARNHDAGNARVRSYQRHNVPSPG